MSEANLSLAATAPPLDYTDTRSVTVTSENDPHGFREAQRGVGDTREPSEGGSTDAQLAGEEEDGVGGGRRDTATTQGNTVRPSHVGLTVNTHIPHSPTLLGDGTSPTFTRRGSAQAATAGDEGSGFIVMDLTVPKASVKSILAHYISLAWLLLVPGVLFVIAIILPFWLQRLDVVTSYTSAFPLVRSPPLALYARYAPCRVFRLTMCDLSTELRNFSQVLAEETADRMPSPIRRLLLRTGRYVPIACEYNVESQTIGNVPVSLSTAHSIEPTSAAIDYSFLCGVDTPLLPMVNITSAIVGVSFFAAALPQENQTVGLEPVASANLLDESILNTVVYRPDVSSCADMLMRCGDFGYSFLWVGEDNGTSGYIHQCPATAGPGTALGRAVVPQRRDEYYTVVRICTETLYEEASQAPGQEDRLSVVANVSMHFYGQLGGIRLVGIEVLTTVGLILPVVMFIVMEVLLAFAGLMIIMVGYTLPVHRFKLQQLATAVVIDTNILADAIARRSEPPSQHTSPGVDGVGPTSPDRPASTGSPVSSQRSPTAVTGGPTSPSASAGNSAMHGVEMATISPYGEAVYLPYDSGEHITVAAPPNSLVGQGGDADKGESPGEGAQREEREGVGGGEGRSGHSDPLAEAHTPASCSVAFSANASPPVDDEAGPSAFSPAEPVDTPSESVVEVEGMAVEEGCAPGSPSSQTQSPLTLAGRIDRLVDATFRQPLTRQRSGTSGDPSPVDTSPLLTMSRVLMGADAVAPQAVLPSYESLVSAGRQTMLQKRRRQTSFIRAILLVQSAAICLAILFAVLCLAFVYTGIGNPVGGICHSSGYQSCRYTRTYRAQYVTLTTIAMFLMIILILFQFYVIRKQVW